MAIIGSWVIDGIIKADANKVANEMYNIGQINGNDEFTPQELVNYARNNPNSELYKCFEWNDTIAAEKYRIRQAGDVIRFLRITIPTEEGNLQKTKIRLFVNTNNYDNSYKATEIVFQNKTEYDKLLAEANAELQAFKQKYKGIKELGKILALIP